MNKDKTNKRNFGYISERSISAPNERELSHMTHPNSAMPMYTDSASNAPLGAYGGR